MSEAWEEFVKMKYGLLLRIYNYMFNINNFIFVFACLSFSSATHAFDIANFKTGMTREEVKAQLPGWGFDKILDTAPDTLFLYDNLEKETHRRFRLQFCNERLQGVEQWVKASSKHFATMSSNYTRQYGQPIWFESGVNVISSGEKHSIYAAWRNGEDFISLRHAMFPVGEDLSVFHESTNPCWKSPQK
ncbi:MAG: hypothetical protein RL020_971 [Pseudomonadota bacterium]|jgi:hypothetical protein